MPLGPVSPQMVGPFVRYTACVAGVRPLPAARLLVFSNAAQFAESLGAGGAVECGRTFVRDLLVVFQAARGGKDDQTVLTGEVVLKKAPGAQVARSDLRRNRHVA